MVHMEGGESLWVWEVTLSGPFNMNEGFDGLQHGGLVLQELCKMVKFNTLGVINKWLRE